MVDENYTSFEVEQNEKYKTNPYLIKIIHQSWKSHDIPSFFKPNMKTWKSCFPHWEHKFWTDDDNRAFIVKHYPWFLAKYDSFPSSIFRADTLRYVYMLHFGGIYTDLDNECLFPFEHLIANYSFVFSEITPSHNYIQNSFMYSRPHHPFWVEVLINIMNRKVDNTADVITGPTILTNTILKYISMYPKSHNIKIYQGRYFNPISYVDQTLNPTYCKIYNAMSKEEKKRCKDFYEKYGSYVIQYHTHVWE